MITFKKKLQIDSIKTSVNEPSTFRVNPNYRSAKMVSTMIERKKKLYFFSRVMTKCYYWIQLVDLSMTCWTINRQKKRKKLHSLGFINPFKLCLTVRTVLVFESPTLTNTKILPFQNTLIRTQKRITTTSFSFLLLCILTKLS